MGLGDWVSAQRGVSRAKGEDKGIRVGWRQRRKRGKQILKLVTGMSRNCNLSIFTLCFVKFKKNNEGKVESMQAFQMLLYCFTKKGFGTQRGYINESRCDHAEVTTQHM